MKAIIFILFLCALCTASVLSDEAASMQAGEWRVLNTNGFTKELLDPVPSDPDNRNILTWTDEAFWDHRRNHLLFLGQGHGQPECRFLDYVEETNTWNLIDAPGAMDDLGHAYNHSTIDYATGTFYHRHMSARPMIYRYFIDSDTWFGTFQIPSSLVEVTHLACCAAIAFHSDLNRLYVCNGLEGGIYYLDFKTGWHAEARQLHMGSYHNFAKYDPHHKLIVCGGGNGSGHLYVIDSTGTLQNRNRAPFDLGVSHTVFTQDPVSGKWLVFTRTGQFYEYDIVQDRWTNLNRSNVPVFIGGGIHGLVAAPINTHGVVMFLRYDVYNSNVMLYKHTESSSVENPRLRTLKPPDGMITLHDIRGRVVARGRNLSTSHLPMGVYIKRTETGKYKRIFVR